MTKPYSMQIAQGGNEVLLLRLNRYGSHEVVAKFSSWELAERTVAALNAFYGVKTDDIPTTNIIDLMNEREKRCT